MTKKIITPLFLIIFVILFSVFYSGEYIEFHKSSIVLKKQQLEIKEKLNTFSLKKIKELENTQIYYTPNKKLLDEIVLQIDNSKDLVYIEVYILTEKRIQKALIRAYKRGINVKVILEKNPYKATNINNKTFTKLNKAGIDIVWSNPKNYSLNHTKLFLIDNLAIISTGNLSYSTFTINRDFFVFTKDKNIYSKLIENFIFDYKGIANVVYDNNLIISPNYTRYKFETIINEAENDIKMYFQYMKDLKMKNLLIKRSKNSNIQIKAIISKQSYLGNKKEIEEMKTAGIQIIIMKKEKMHSKAILIDEKYLFLGSINFSNYSIDKNREIGILLKNENIINNFLKIFNQDIENNL